MKFKILIVMVLGMAVSACEMLTEPDLDNQFPEERIISDAAFAEGVLLGAYRLLPNDYTFEEVATDDAVSNQRGNQFLRMATGEWSARFNPLDKWDAAYDAIFNLNYFLSVVDEVEWSWQSPERNEVFRKRFTGEALALRGYFYFQLLERYAGVASDGTLMGVPLVTEVLSTEDNWEIPRSTYQECVDQIMSDFNEALSLAPSFPETWTLIDGDDAHNRAAGPENQHRINGKAVRALKARVALHAASPAFNPGGSTAPSILAAQLAAELIDERGGPGALPSDGVVFYNANDDITNPEIIWRNNSYTNNVREVANFPPAQFGNGRVNPSQNLVDAFPMANGYPIDDALSGYDPNNPYAGRDPRLKAYIIYDGNSLGSNVIQTDVNSPINGLNRTPDYSTRTGYYLAKLLRSDVNLSPTTFSSAIHFYAHIRYTELYLIYAEAANEAYGPDDANTAGFTARDVVAAIRARAGIAQPDAYLASITTKEEMRELIRNERRLELCFEGHRFWDMRRWNMDLTEPVVAVAIDESEYTYSTVENRAYPDHAVYGPVPFLETLKYGGLLQNQGW